MDAGFDGVFFHDSSDEAAIADGALIERDGGVEGFAMAMAEIVEDDNVLTFACEPLDGDAADITCTAGDQGRHNSLSCDELCS
jgi:hypothetical protein